MMKNFREKMAKIKKYSSVLEMVKEISSPEFAAEFEQHHNTLEAIKKLVRSLPPGDRLSVIMGICTHCGEMRTPEYWDKPYCVLCEEHYLKNSS
jgi:hypothetical protein